MFHRWLAHRRWTRFPLCHCFRHCPPAHRCLRRHCCLPLHRCLRFHCYPCFHRCLCFRCCLCSHCCLCFHRWPPARLWRCCFHLRWSLHPARLPRHGCPTHRCRLRLPYLPGHRSLETDGAVRACRKQHRVWRRRAGSRRERICGGFEKSPSCPINTPWLQQGKLHGRELQHAPGGVRVVVLGWRPWTSPARNPRRAWSRLRRRSGRRRGSLTIR